MKIAGREIGPGQPPYIIAELGVNHDGSVERALELTRAAAAAGADAVKLQLFETDRLLSKAAKLAAYQKAAGETDPVAMLRRLELGIDDMARVVDLAHGLGVHAIVTVFSVELVEVAERLGWDAYKTASPDIVHRPLLEAMAATGRPMIVSTGASTIGEVAGMLEWTVGARDRLAVLQCVSCYPAAPEDAALGGMAGLARMFDGPIGYSDHTSSETTGGLAVSMGAELLEKHVTYSRGASGPDHAASLEPDEFGRYVHGARRGSVGSPGLRRKSSFSPPATDRLDPRVGACSKVVLACERDAREVSRQSIVLVRPMRAGESVRRADITFKRPGTGIGPWSIDRIVGRVLARGLEADVPLAEADLS